MRLRPWVGVAALREIAAQHPAGADADLIRDGIGMRDDEIVLDDELHAVLERLRLADMVRLKGGRWHLTRALLDELPRTDSGALSVFSESFRKLAHERIDPILPLELHDEVRHGALWFQTEESRGAHVAHERYVEDRDMLAVVLAKRGMYRAALYERSRDYRWWPMVWGELDGHSWFPTLDAAVAHLEDRIAPQPDADG